MADVEQIVRNVLRDFNDPPSADYSPFEYGMSIADELDEKSIALLVGESIRHLPGVLADSFLNGMLDRHSISSLKDILLEALPHGSEMGSASTVVRFLIHRCHMARFDLVARLVSEIERSTEAHAQDLYAFAIWLALGDADATRQMTTNGADDGLIRSILRELTTIHLTKYARETLDRCKRIAK